MKLKFTDFLNPKGQIERVPFFISGLILFIIKYYIDKFVNYFFFHRFWFITDYFVRADELLLGELSDQDLLFFQMMALTSVPFIWMGTMLCVKRLRNANLSIWLVLFFFIPFLNFLLFLILSAIPERNMPDDGQSNNFVSKLIPKTKKGSAAFAIAATLILSLFLTMFSANWLENYGWGLFIGVPFFIGFGSVYLSSYHQKRGLKESLGIATMSMFMFSVVILAFAFEGLVCIIMAFPIGLALGLIGGMIGYYLQDRNKPTAIPVILLMFSIPFLSFIEEKVNPKPMELSVSTSVVIEASIEEVWHEVINFDEIDPPTEYMFLNGISYPIKARLEYKEDTIRYCVFNNGTFVEPITKWSSTELLEFSVKDQPEPMRELSPYGHIDAPHLHGYFKTTKGQFLLKKINGNKIVLKGTTWYVNDVWPNFYWRWWTDYIIQNIHHRVLDHIKEKAEE